MPEMTHEHLRRRAVQWLTNTKNCGVVLSEMRALTMEIPDAIGFQSHSSIVVECKISRSDFRANEDKCHVRAGSSVGQYRYFLTPDTLVQPEEVADPYGLLWLRQSSIAIKKSALHCDTYNLEAERTMLVSALRRVRVREFLVIVPEPDCLELKHA